MSHYNQPAPEGKDPELWDTAQKRAGFKRHLTTYVIINAFLWGIWYFTGNQYNGLDINKWSTAGKYPWPIWSTLGWGIGLSFHYAGAYIFPKSNSVEQEYEKLKNKQPKNQ
ncbi:MAG: 2TM domain-containing protein [Rhizobacter sp.]|nr:2TM domain-containing protein [Ferruginibacter sp.]